jgi:hypothetical protein
MRGNFVVYMNPRFSGRGSVTGIGLVLKRRGAIVTRIFDVFTDEEIDSTYFVHIPLSLFDQIVQRVRVALAKRFASGHDRQILKLVEEHTENFYNYLKDYYDFNTEK